MHIQYISSYSHRHVIYSSLPCVLQPSHEEVALKDLQMSPGSCLNSETQALIQQTPSSCGFSSPLSRPSDRLEPGGLPLKHSHSRESVCSLRRASSLHDIDGMRDQWSGMSVCVCNHLVLSIVRNITVCKTLLFLPHQTVFEGGKTSRQESTEHPVSVSFSG